VGERSLRLVQKPTNPEDAIARRPVTSAPALFAAILLVGGCLAPGAYPRLSEGDNPVIPTWVVDHGWHTAIVVRRGDVDRALWPEVDDFPEATFIEVAWGDREFYMARPATPWLAIKAALLASGSVLHVVGFSGLVATHYAESAVVDLRLSRGGFDAMTRFIHEEYQRDREDRPLRLERGLYGTSWFYAARSRYHLFNTCNTWVTRALSTAGLAVAPAGVITAGEVMRQVKRADEARAVERGPAAK
jgi:uncharacterized protein (TIGR02117 family)